MTNWTEMEMAFPDKVLGRLKEHIWHCEICGQYSEYLEGHSASGLHIIAEKNCDQFEFRVYDTSQGHKALKRRSAISERMAKEFIIVAGRNSDCLMVCPSCHDEIARIALAQAKLEDPKFKGRAAPPALIFRVTRDMRNRGKSLTYSIKI